MSIFKKEPERSTEDVRREEGTYEARPDEVRDEARRDEVERQDTRPRDTRAEDDEQMRSNPEIQGRAEPQEELLGRRGGPGAGAERRMGSSDMAMGPDMRKYKTRMASIHSMFIDDPKKAVVEAERLIDEMVDYMAKSMHEQVRRWHKDVENNADTERLRLMMREFSQMMDRFERRQAA